VLTLQIEEATTVKLVGTGLGDGIELTSCSIAKLGVEVITKQSEVLNRVLNNFHGWTSRRLVVVVDTVEVKAIAVRSNAADDTSKSVYAGRLLSHVR
jgi:hypothetical protein